MIYHLTGLGFAKIGGYTGLESKFLDAQPNITREYYNLMSQGENATDYQMRYAKCGKNCIVAIPLVFQIREEVLGVRFFAGHVLYKSGYWGLCFYSLQKKLPADKRLHPGLVLNQIAGNAKFVRGAM